MSSKALLVIVFVVAAFASASPAAQSIAAPSLDYDYYKVKVQPIFMARSLPASVITTPPCTVFLWVCAPAATASAAVQETAIQTASFLRNW